MNPEPFPCQDFLRVQKNLQRALQNTEDTYLLLTGETGTGKTALLRQLTRQLDRFRYRCLYFAHAQQLKPFGFIRVLARFLRLSPCRCHPETVHSLLQQLREDPQWLLLWFDEGHDLPEETLAEARSLAESDLGPDSRLQILLSGLPPLRERLHARPHLWRRFLIREELAGLSREEMPPFLDHHFDKDAHQRFSEEGLSLLFERGRGIPGLILPLVRRALLGLHGQEKIHPTQLEDLLAQWDLT